MHRTNEKITKTRRIFFFLIWQETRKSRVLIIEGYRGYSGVVGKRGSGLCFSAYLIIRGGTIAGERRAKMWHAMAQLCKASGNDKDVFDRRARIWLSKRDRLRKSTPPSCETSNYYVTFLPVVLQRRPSLSKIFTQSFRLSFVNMRSDSPRCACAKLFRDSLIISTEYIITLENSGECSLIRPTNNRLAM